MLSRPEDLRPLKLRFQLMLVVTVVVFMVLAGRLFQLQVLEGDQYSSRAERNFIQSIDVEAPRGRIFDSKGRPLAVNRPAYTLMVTGRPRVLVEDEATETAELRRIPVSDAQVEELATLIDFQDESDNGKFVARIEELRDDERSGRYAVAIRSNLSDREYARIKTREQLASWVDIRKRARRYYPEGALTAFITGYMREISREELERRGQAGYRVGDRIGKTGLERQWENYLRGRIGLANRVVNSLGIPVVDPPAMATAALADPVEPIPGQDIHVSIDVELQRVAADAFGSVRYDEVSKTDYGGRRAGGLVAMEAKTGRILAMVSVPSIDPNEWEQPITRTKFGAWTGSPFKPFIDKTIQENFFPGSTYKVVSALSMLVDSSYDPDEIIECGRYVEYGGRKFRDTHACGPVALEDAIIQSCNVYFYRLAMERGLTLSKMEATARSFGLGEPTGLGINSEASGTVPTEASEIRQGSFQQGVRLNSAIGQGNVKVTVLQLAVLYAAIANGGAVVTPSLVDRIETRDGKLVFENEPRLREASPPLESFDRERIHRGLVGVVNDPTGTAYSERLNGITVAGKTGTAQVGRERRRVGEKEIVGWDTTQDHAWFAGYAPAEDPEIVVVALVAHGGAGAAAAAPIVMRVIGDYLGGRRAGSVDRTVSPARRDAGVPPPLPGGDGKAAR